MLIPCCFIFVFPRVGVYTGDISEKLQCSSKEKKVGNVSVIALVLQVSIGDGDGLPSGGLFACLPPMLYKKKHL